MEFGVSAVAAATQQHNNAATKRSNKRQQQNAATKRSNTSKYKQYNSFFDFHSTFNHHILVVTVATFDRYEQ